MTRKFWTGLKNLFEGLQAALKQESNPPSERSVFTAAPAQRLEDSLTSASGTNLGLHTAKVSGLNTVNGMKSIEELLYSGARLGTCFGSCGVKKRDGLKTDVKKNKKKTRDI